MSVIDKIVEQRLPEFVTTPQYLQEQDEFESWALSVLHSSGALSDLRQIQETLLKGKVKKHELVIDLKKGSARLVWGEHFRIKQGEVAPELVKTGFISREKLDCSELLVHLEDQSEGLMIEGAEWTNVFRWENRMLVDHSIAQAFLSPRILKSH